MHPTVRGEHATLDWNRGGHRRSAAGCGVGRRITARPLDGLGSYEDSASCGSFTNYYQGSFTENGTTTFDKNGNPVKDIIHQSGSELDWRSGSTDSYTVNFNFTRVHDYATGTNTLNGMVIKVTYPGLGILFHDVGQIVHLPGGVTVIHGPHDVWEQVRTRIATRSSRSRTESRPTRAEVCTEPPGKARRGGPSYVLPRTPAASTPGRTRAVRPFCLTRRASRRRTPQWRVSTECVMVAWGRIQ